MRTWLTKYVLCWPLGILLCLYGYLVVAPIVFIGFVIFCAYDSCADFLRDHGSEPPSMLPNLPW